MNTHEEAKAEEKAIRRDLAKVMMQGMFSNSNHQWIDANPSQMARKAVRAADILLKELEVIK